MTFGAFFVCTRTRERERERERARIPLECDRATRGAWGHENVPLDMHLQNFSADKSLSLLIKSLNYALTIRGSRECLSLEHFADATFFVLLRTLTLFMVSRFRNNIEVSVL